MKKTLQIFAFATIVLAALASCAKDQFKENVIPAGEKIQVSINGQIGNFTPADATKATAESVVRVTWKSGDKVYVYDGTASIGTLTVTPDNNNASYALLSGTITASAASPAPTRLTLVYVKGATEAPAIAGGKISIDLSSQDEAEVPFVLYTTVDYDAAALTKTNEYTSFSFATSVMTVNCTGLQTGASGDVEDITKAEIEGVSTVCELAVTGSGVTVAGASKGKITRTGTGEPSVFTQSDSRGSFKLALAADPTAPAARNILVHQGSKVSGSPFTSATLAAGKSYNTVYQMCEYIAPPAGVLPGGFTVNAQGKKVHFSKGNLYAKKESGEWKWHFYDEQYQYNSIPVDNSGERTATDGDTEIDLFTWGYNATYSIDPIGYDYVTGHSIDGETFTKNEDWGYVFGGESSVWRTLTREEWMYLFATDTDSPRYNRHKLGVKICGKENCMVLLPDNWDETVISLTSFASQMEYNENSAPTWAEMAEAGAVCLPAAGQRYGPEVKECDGKSYYWSSSATDMSGIGITDDAAAYVTFDGSEVWVGAYPGFYGYSVRLVTESGEYTPTEKVTGVSLNKSKTTIDLGDNETLVATVAPANAANKQVTWKSSDEDVATVENGVVTGVAVGSAVITATTIDGNFTAVCLVTVEKLSLPGEFTINSNQDKIHFAKGNLYCSRTSSTSSDWTWHFYDEQYQYNNSYTQTDQSDSPIAAASDTQIDLFTWGYDSEKSINPVGTDYVTGYATDGATFSKSEDWGYVFGGNSSHWRTLTKDEWGYMISTRTDADDKLGFATIGAVKGLVILPDSFTLPAECTFTSKSVDPYYENTYTQGDSGTWKAMEDAGAVFLPAVGRRLNGSELNNRGDICRYWSSSAKNGTNSYHLLANYRNEIETSDNERFKGFSIRLVK